MMTTSLRKNMNMNNARRTEEKEWTHNKNDTRRFMHHNTDTDNWKNNGHKSTTSTSIVNILKRAIILTGLARIRKNDCW